MAQARPSPSWRVFSIVWAGQLVSLTGSGLTSFVLGSTQLLMLLGAVAAWPNSPRLLRCGSRGGQPESISP